MHGILRFTEGGAGNCVLFCHILPLRGGRDCEFYLGGMLGIVHGILKFPHCAAHGMLDLELGKWKVKGWKWK